MTQIRINKAARLLGVSDDTLRRWAGAGRIGTSTDDAGRQVVDGLELAKLAQGIAEDQGSDEWDDRATVRSARNHLTGLVLSVTSDRVMSQVELQCGRHRVVSLISTEAVRSLGLEPGAVATAVIKATDVCIEGDA